MAAKSKGKKIKDHLVMVRLTQEDGEKLEAFEAREGFGSKSAAARSIILKGLKK